MALDGREPSSVSAGEPGWVLVLRPLTPSACSSSSLFSTSPWSKVVACSIAKRRYIHNVTVSTSLAG
jgi:hypothetical protein